jgi:hypothetical protein
MKFKQYSEISMLVFWVAALCGPVGRHKRFGEDQHHHPRENLKSHTILRNLLYHSNAGLCLMR